MNRCCIALGANLDDPRASFDRAYKQLEQHQAIVLKRSSLLRTPPMGIHAGPEFLNAAAVIETELSAAELLQMLHRIECVEGRTRTTVWGPRTLDLDLIFYGDEIIESEDLIVPHPLSWFRRFVLQPLNEVAPAWRHPALGETVHQLNRRLSVRPLVISLPGLSERQRDELLQRLQCLIPALVDAISLVDTTEDKNAFAVVDLTVGRRAASRQPPLERRRVLRPFWSTHCDNDVVMLDKLGEYLRDVIVAALPGGCDTAVD